MLEVVCSAGGDGGLMQHFLLEVINSGPVPTSPSSSSPGDNNGGAQGGGGVDPDEEHLPKTGIFDMENNNELSTLNDQVSERRRGK